MSADRENKRPTKAYAAPAVSADQDPDEVGAIEKANEFRRTVAEVVRGLCDSQVFPEVLFFTDYGGRSAQQADVYSDMDIRCIYVGSLSGGKRKEIEQVLRAEIAQKSTSHRLIELKFQALPQYLTGVVGEDGEYTVTEALNVSRMGSSPKIEASSVLATYTYATTKLLSHSVAEVQKLVTEAVSRSTDPQLLQLQQSASSVEVRPSEILKRIKLDAAGAVDWLHLFVFQFYELLEQQPELMGSNAAQSSRQPAKAELIGLQFRLAKYKVRIAFGVVLASLTQEELGRVQRIWLSGLKTQQVPDHLKHLLQRDTKAKPWLDAAEVSADMLLALLIRAFGEKIFTQPELDDLLQGAALRSGDAKKIKSLEQQTEAQLKASNTEHIVRVFDLALAAGGQKRRAVPGETRDPHVTGRSIEFCLLNLLKEQDAVETVVFADGETILEQGAASDHLLFLPPIVYKQTPDGTVVRNTNGHCVVEVVANDKVQRISREGASVVGEMGPLLGIGRTARVVASGEVVAYKVDAQRILALLQDKENKGLIYSGTDPKDLPSCLELHLLQYLLQYLTYEFIATVRDRAPRSAPAAWEETQNAINNPEQNTLAQWYLPGFAEKFKKAALRHRRKIEDFSGMQQFGIELCAQDTTLFTRGDESNGCMYLVLEATRSPAIELSNFVGNPDAVVYLEKDGIIGEQVLLGTGVRTATAVAKKGTRLLRVPSEFFQTMVDLPGTFGKNATQNKVLLYHLLSVCVYRATRDVKG